MARGRTGRSGVSRAKLTGCESSSDAVDPAGQVGQMLRSGDPVRIEDAAGVLQRAGTSEELTPVLEELFESPPCPLRRASGSDAFAAPRFGIGGRLDKSEDLAVVQGQDDDEASRRVNLYIDDLTADGLLDRLAELDTAKRVKSSDRVAQLIPRLWTQTPPPVGDGLSVDGAPIGEINHALRECTIR